MIARFGWNRSGVRWVDDELRVLALQFAVLYDDSDDLGCVLAIICLKFIHHIMKKQHPKSVHLSNQETAAPTLKNSQVSLISDNYIIDTQSFQHNELDSAKQSLQEIKQEQVSIVSLNHWKSHSSNKRQNFSQQSFTKLLNKGRVVQEDNNEKNAYPTPHINQKLIHSICDDLTEMKMDYLEGASTEVDQAKEESKQSKRQSQMLLLQKLQQDVYIRPKETQEMQRKHTNEQLVNKILFNKLSKNLCNQNQAKNATSEVLNSFKSLTTMFKTVHQLINYNEIYNQIIQQQKMPNRVLIVTKEFDKDLERQQQNFNDIVQNKLAVIRDQIAEVKSKKLQLKDLRIENCTLRDNIAAIFQKVEQIRKDYLKNMQICLGDAKADKKKVFQSLRKEQEEESNKEMQTLSHFRQELEQNTMAINELEHDFAEIHELKNTSRQELAEFLRTVLKNEDIQYQFINHLRIQDSLITILKLMLHIKTNISMADFPTFMDVHSRTYILGRSSLELELEGIKRLVKNITNRLSNFETTQLRALKNQGNRPFFEFKMRQIKQAFSEMKNENRHVKQNLSSQSHIEVPTERALPTSGFVTPKSDEVQQLQELKLKQHELEESVDRLEKAEIARLKAINQSKQLGMSQIQRLVKSVQAEFGAKRMNRILMDVFNDQKQGQMQTDNSIPVIQVQNLGQVKEVKELDKKEDRFYFYRNKQQRMRSSYNNLPDINFNYDPTYNQIPYLQNRYLSSTFFPHSVK